MDRQTLDDLGELLLPTPEQTLLLRCCVGEEDAVGEAWAAWSEAVGNAKEAFRGSFNGLAWLVPLLSSRLEEAGIDVDGDTRVYLRMASFRESLRTEVFRRVLAELLPSLLDAEGTLLLIGDVAAADRSHEDWTHRHCAEIAVLCEPGAARALARRMEAGGLEPDPVPRIHRHQMIRLRHTSGIPVSLWWDAVPSPHYTGPPSMLAGHGVRREIEGRPTLVPDAAALLFAVLGHAVGRDTRNSLAWAVDAHRLATGDDVDWDAFERLVALAGVRTPFSLMCRYLKSHLRAPIPERLRTVTSPESGERDGLLSAAQQTRGVDARALLGGSPRLRRVTLESLVRPSPGYLRKRYGVSRSWSLPLLYALRLLAPLRGARS